MKKAILIKFGDNDFHRTFMHAMEQLHKKDFIYELSKEKIAFVFSEILFASYLVAQNNLEYNGLQNLDSNYIKRIKEYLVIKPSKVYTGDNALKLLMEWDNGDSYYMTPYDFGTA